MNFSNINKDELNGWDKWSPSECKYEEKHWFAYALGIFLIVGVFVSWASQHIAILRSKSSQGISWVTIFLANVSTSCNTINVILEDFNKTIRCCGIFGTSHCNEALLSTYQIASGWINSVFVFILILIYFPKDILKSESIVINSRSVTPFHSSDSKGSISSYESVPNFDTTHLTVKKVETGPNYIQKRRGIIAFIIYILFCLILFPGISVLLYSIYGGSDSSPTIKFAFSLGILSTVCNVLQYTPQIIKTLFEKEVGSLSIVMLLLQAPGSFMVVVFQGVLYKENVSTWLPFFITGIQQVILLTICIVFELRKRRQAKSIETQPLLDPENLDSM